MSQLLKSAIADAKAIRQTALENARVALTEAFTPKLQSMLSQKIAEEVGEAKPDTHYADGMEAGKGVKEAYTTVDKDTDKAQINLSEEGEIPGEEEEVPGAAPVAVGAPQIDPNAVELDVDATPGEEVDVVPTGTGEVQLEPAADPNAMGAPEVPGLPGAGEEQGAGDLDLESIIAELEAEAGAEESPAEPNFGGAEAGSEDPSVNVTAVQAPDDVTVDFSDETGAEDPSGAASPDDEEVNLEEILRELESDGGAPLEETLTTGQSLSSHTEQPQKGNFGSDKTGTNGTPSKGGTEPAIEKAESDKKYGKDGGKVGDNFEDFGKATKTLTEENKKLKKSLSEHIETVEFLKGKINEVNLLNAKLLYTNKLFRNFPLTNEQKVKVVEQLDLTKNVREVKLVYTTLAESFSFGSSKMLKKPVSSHKVITEGLASKVTASTKPTKEILTEGTEMANRFKKLAGIVTPSKK